MTSWGAFKSLAASLTIALFLLSAVTGTGHAADEMFTIGILNSVPTLSSAVDGFKAGMSEFGYIEGENVQYIFRGLLQDDNDIIDIETDHLLSQKVDLLLTLGNETTSRAKLATKETGTPILISGCNKPVESGLIENRIHPGGNITGVCGLPRTHKTLEWMKTAIPGLKMVYVPYNPDDGASVVSLPELKDGADQLGIELALQEVRTVEEAVAAIHELTEDVQAVFLIHSPTLNPGSSELSRAAIERGLPTGADLALDGSVLLTYTIDVFALGKQTARLAHHIFKGAKPGDLPFETADAFLTVNLRTAEKIGLEIPSSTLALAEKIIR